jgi:hypothetical protein
LIEERTLELPLHEIHATAPQSGGSNVELRRYRARFVFSYQKKNLASFEPRLI